MNCLSNQLIFYFKYAEPPPNPELLKTSSCFTELESVQHCHNDQRDVNRLKH